MDTPRETDQSHPTNPRTAEEPAVIVNNSAAAPSQAAAVATRPTEPAAGSAAAQDIEVNTSGELGDGDADTIAEASETFKEQQKLYKYTAFISYRHVEPDATLAAAIHKMVETFSVPKEFYENGKKPVFRVFRDREELTATDLSLALDDALRHSKFLIVICSKRTPKSPWCVREVENFLALHGPDRIIPVLVEGEPHESFPPPLLGLTKQVVDLRGQVTEESKEILAADLRPQAVQEAGFEGYEALQARKDPRLSSLTQQALALLKVEKYRIMAAILGCSYGDLKQRDKERRQRLMLIGSAAASVFFLVFGAFMFNAYRNENIARVKAVQNNAAMQLLTAGRYLTAGDRVKALLISQNAMNQLDEKMPLYSHLKAQHTGILNGSIYNQTAAVRTVINTDNSLTYSDISPDSQYVVAGLGHDSVGVWQVDTGALVKRLSGHTEQVKVLAYNRAGTRFASGGFDDTLIAWDGKTYEQLKRLPQDGDVLLVDFSFDDKLLLCVVGRQDNYVLRCYDTESWQPAGKEIVMPKGTIFFSVDPKANRVLVSIRALAQDQSLKLYDFHTGEELRSYKDLLFTREDKETGVPKPTPLPYVKAVFSYDGKSIYASTEGYAYAKLDVENGQELGRTPESERYWIKSEEYLRLMEAEDGQSFYVADRYKIDKYDASTGKKLASINFGNQQIRDYRLSRDGHIVAIFETGGIGLAAQDQVIDNHFPYGEGLATAARFTPDSRFIVFNSLQDRNIKIADLATAGGGRQIAGQMAITSQNGKYTLYYNGGRFFVWDNEKNEKSLDIAEKALSSKSTHLYETGPTFSLSPDGKRLAMYYRLYTDDGTRLQSTSVRVIDLATGETLLDADTEKLLRLPFFLPDGKTLLMANRRGDAYVYNLDTKAAVHHWKIARGEVIMVGASDDGKHFFLQYLEGKSVLYETDTGKEVIQLPGKIIHAAPGKDGALEVRGVLGGQAFLWTKAAGTKYIALPKERDQLGTGLYTDYEIYNPAAGLLLSIRNGEKPTSTEEKRAYLIDFASGQLLKSFVLRLKDYPILGCISADGKRVILDTEFQFISKAKEEGGSDYQSILKSYIYELHDYQKLKEAAGAIVGSRTLTKEELKEIGIE